MTPSQLASRVEFLIKQLLDEWARDHNEEARLLLDQKRTRLIYAWRSAYSPDPEVRAAVTQQLDTAIDLMVEAVTARTERQLEERNTP